LKTPARRAALETFRAAGISISIDDYGTGQSTLNYLKLLPVTERRPQHAARHIDDRGDAMLVRSVQLATRLVKVVAGDRGMPLALPS
jgi:EAL domain-containing protein (putative c-di-GMP-specific phosphodiesterase class I)